MEAALNLIEEALIWIDARGMIERCNAAAKRLLHHHSGELTGQPLVKILPLRQWGKPVLTEEHPGGETWANTFDSSKAANTASVGHHGCYEFMQPGQSQWVKITAVPISAASSADALAEHPAWAGNGKLVIIRPINEPCLEQAGSNLNSVSSLQHLTELYRQALDCTQIGIWDWDLQTNTGSLSPKAAELLGLGFDGGKTTYSAWRQAVHPKDIQQVEQSLGRAIATRSSYETEYRILFPDGSLHWRLARGQGIYDSSGQPLRIIGVLMDISERKRDAVMLRLAEEAWQENQQILHAIMANLPGGVFRCLYLPNETVVFAYASAAYQELLGLSPQEMGAQPQLAFERIHPDDRQQWQTIVETARLTLEPSYLEYRVILPDGQEKWLARTARFSWALNGDFVVDGIDIDITAQKAGAVALVASQQFIQKVAEATPGVLYVYDLIEQCNIYANREVGTVLGYTPTEIQAMGSRFVTERLHPDDQVKAQSYFSQFDKLADGAKVGWEYRLRHADGSWRWLYSQDTIFARTATGKPRLILGTVIDITERKQTEIAFRSILQGTASATGEAFFSGLVQNMAQALDVRYAFVSELDGEYLQTLAFWADGQIQPPQRFELACHPCCHMAITQGFVCYPSQAQQQFPDNSTLKLLQAESYLGVAMLDGAGNPIGNLCIVDDQPLKAVDWAEAILRIFAARAAAELERQRATIALQQLNQDLEARVEQRTQELIASLDEKEVLLKEVHHRVKNNLQMIQSLLNLQMRLVEEPKALDVLAESQRRIRAMALVHEKLYQSNRLARINFAEYGRSLMRDLLQSYPLNSLAIRLSLEIAEVELPVDTAISCGLIINELFSNAVKYAFPEKPPAVQSGLITIQFQLHSEAPQPGQPQPSASYRLTVADNGVGIPAEVDVGTTKSLGLRLVHALTRQLRGTLHIERQTTERPTGTTFTISFASQDKPNNCNDTNPNSNC